ncbi:hypothetical protein PMIN01_10380 [Paraphaeosphaeria minitans]|uniref:Uncharacterized protein n=1 Tax=Paraphaeosphaeria minitans TaxID=565426 RepID=A0A9P6KLB9_9PLEO|nr:hypothetical protein PMIN01_10380 [Paraphaeosphaeria minitans]
MSLAHPTPANTSQRAGSASQLHATRHTPASQPHASLAATRQPSTPPHAPALDIAPSPQSLTSLKSVQGAHYSPPPPPFSKQSPLVPKSRLSLRPSSWYLVQRAARLHAPPGCAGIFRSPWSPASRPSSSVQCLDHHPSPSISIQRRDHHPSPSVFLPSVPGSPQQQPLTAPRGAIDTHSHTHTHTHTHAYAHAHQTLTLKYVARPLSHGNAP